MARCQLTPDKKAKKKKHFVVEKNKMASFGVLGVIGVSRQFLSLQNQRTKMKPRYVRGTHN
jgi:hypothetical protein